MKNKSYISTVIANWKMHNDFNAALDLVIKIFSYSNMAKNVEKIICPPAVNIIPLYDQFKNSTFSLGAQNINENNEIPKSGLNFLTDNQNKLDKNFLLLCGFENFGNYYIRVDILEKLFLKIIDSTKNGKFKISSEMMNLLGCSKENFYKVMELMDYKREKKDEDIFCYKGLRKINKIKFFKRKNNPFQKLSSLNLK